MGIELLFPFDVSVTEPQDIKNLNKKLIEKSDFVVADISPFIGPSMDPGTAYEIGYAEALGKWVYLYSEMHNTTFIQRVPECLKDLKNYENFGLTENLMITACNNVYKSYEDALEAIVLERNM